MTLWAASVFLIASFYCGFIPDSCQGYKKVNPARSQIEIDAFHLKQ